MREAMRKPKRYKITIEVVPGVQVSGEFEVVGGTITVYYRDETDTMQLEGLQPGYAARLLLRELAQT